MKTARMICAECDLGPCRNEMIGKPCGYNHGLMVLKDEDLKELREAIEGCRAAILAEINPLVKPFLVWFEKQLENKLRMMK